jgi:hypothetical protein
MPNKYDITKIDSEANYARKREFMTDEETNRVQDYISEVNLNIGDMSAMYAEYADIEEYYQNDQEEKPKQPNTKINILVANIEGQAAMVIEQNMAVTTVGESAGDEEFAEDARIGLEWAYRKNRFKTPFRTFVRRFLKFGIGIFSLNFEPEALNGFGLVKIKTIPVNCLLIDRNITNIADYQEADFIAQIIPKVSKKKFIEIYGKEKAATVNFGQYAIEDEVFKVDTVHNYNTVSIIKWWSRKDGKLRLEEFSGCGVLLLDSHKGMNRKANQKKLQVTPKSYHKFVNDKYPIFIAGLYEREGSFWPFGDGKLLLPLQELLNELFDKIRICSRPNLILYDINTELDLDDVDENTLKPRPYDGSAGNTPAHSIQFGQVNPDWWRLINEIYKAAQKVCRFSELMTGQQKAADTATEAAIQQQQGNVATDDKKGIIQPVLIEMSEYMLGLMMENYTEGKSFSTKGEKEYKWVDFREMSNVPVKIPATEKFKTEYGKNNPGTEIPKWQLLTDAKGDPLTKNIDLDIDIDIGQGLPKNKAFLTKFFTDISKVVLISEDGTQKPVVYWEEFRKFLKDYVGLPLSEDELKNIMTQPMPQNPMQPGQGQQVPQLVPQPGQAQGGQPQPSANAEGMTANNAPQQGANNLIRGKF